MKKDQVISFIRSLLIALGAFFAGKMIWGQQLDYTLWQGIVGSAIGLFAVIWGITDKTATLEMVQSGLRSTWLVIGGFLITTGKIKAEMLNNVLAIIAIISPVLYGWISQLKSKNIATGKLPVAELSGVDEKKPDLITPVAVKK